MFFSHKHKLFDLEGYYFIFHLYMKCPFSNEAVIPIIRFSSGSALLLSN